MLLRPSDKSATVRRRLFRIAAGFLASLLSLLASQLVLAQENGLGCRPPTPEERAWADEHSIIVQQVYLNRFGLERLNAERRSKGLPDLREDEVPLAENDAEYTGQTRAGNKAIRATVQKPVVSAGSAISPEPNSDLVSSGPLPASVDNSTLIWFPPI